MIKRQIILFDDHSHTNLLPLTFTRPVAQIRIGILRISEKWQHHIALPISYLTAPYLQPLYPPRFEADNLLLNGSILPDAPLVQAIKSLQINEALVNDKTIIAFRTKHTLSKQQIAQLQVPDADTFEVIAAYRQKQYPLPYTKINQVWDIFQKNNVALQLDFDLLTKNRNSQIVSSSNQIIAPENVFLEQGASVEASFLDASKGPIYVGKNATIMAGSLIQGGLAVCDNATVKMGAKIYATTTIGPYCNVAGEVKGSILFERTNKGHDGFLGDAVLGEWCNLGADTNCSNLKNNYSNVKLWNYAANDYADSGLLKCGLIMGDHSKCSINTMFNTGTVVGVCSNIFGADFPPKFIPSFSWGGGNKWADYHWDKALQTIQTVYGRKNKALLDKEIQVLSRIFERTKTHRSNEK
ncbi:MAG: putative sugar nucleotidyl transferase [Chitinophagales bacterium]